MNHRGRSITHLQYAPKKDIINEAHRRGLSKQALSSLVRYENTHGVLRDIKNILIHDILQPNHACLPRFSDLNAFVCDLLEQGKDELIIELDKNSFKRLISPNCTYINRSGGFAIKNGVGRSYEKLFREFYKKARTEGGISGWVLTQTDEGYEGKVPLKVAYSCDENGDNELFVITLDLTTCHFSYTQGEIHFDFQKQAGALSGYIPQYGGITHLLSASREIHAKKFGLKPKLTTVKLNQWYTFLCRIIIDLHSSQSLFREHGLGISDFTSVFGFKRDKNIEYHQWLTQLTEEFSYFQAVLATGIEHFQLDRPEVVLGGEYPHTFIIKNDRIFVECSNYPNGNLLLSNNIFQLFNF
ncbi:hypothetical protein [Entomospira culicis]|uniref:Uncharacterized protein n=1 Tax=Entomospira culicis TaxID=2719989 RepID=A0A968GH12_9SPIO|nr:hypothetical protein [Entomospira culicis]NIZ19953.1 hypothetical protein [Entomospira culicis]NIZ70182.1 hypothetical protein [Entomospira culicis]WDI38015.1 hypothetical protein PVA46_08175 [Entomospira culicis]WDI39638.1 hypothetical protein PVA47_08175 [Entomospira culicis]